MIATLRTAFDVSVSHITVMLVGKNCPLRWVDNMSNSVFAVYGEILNRGSPVGSFTVKSGHYWAGKHNNSSFFNKIRAY